MEVLDGLRVTLDWHMALFEMGCLLKLGLKDVNLLKFRTILVMAELSDFKENSFRPSYTFPIILEKLQKLINRLMYNQ